MESGGAALDVLPIWVKSDGEDVLASWTFRGDDGAEIRAEPLVRSERDGLDGSGDASSRRLRLDLPPRSRRRSRSRARLPWRSPGEVPLLQVPRDDLEEGRIRVETPAGMRCRARSDGPGRLHVSPVETGRGGTASAEGSDPTAGSGARDRLVRAFSYNEPDVRLEPRGRAHDGDALAGSRARRLPRDVVGRGGASPRPPADAGPVRADAVDVDGAARGNRAGADPTRRGRRGIGPLGATGHDPRADGRGWYALQPDRAGLRSGVGADGQRRVAGPRPAPRGSSLPLLHLGGLGAARLAALDPVGGLLAVARGDPAGWPVGPLGLRGLGWPWWTDRGQPDVDERLGALDGRLGRPPAEDLTLAGWFSHWDAGAVADRGGPGGAGHRRDGPEDAVRTGPAAGRPPRFRPGAAPAERPGGVGLPRRPADHDEGGARAVPVRGAEPGRDRRGVDLGLGPFGPVPDGGPLAR